MKAARIIAIGFLVAGSLTAQELKIPRAEDLVRQDAQAVVALAKEQGKDNQERQDALGDFKRGAGIGLGVALGGKKSDIEEATVVDGKIVVTRRIKDRPRVGLEMHQLFTANIFTQAGRDDARQQLLDCGANPIRCPMLAIGPFASIQSSADNSIDSFALGVMIGARSDPRQTSSFNIGVGLVWDSHVKNLANGFVEGQTPPTGESAVRFTESSARRLLITVSFAF